MWDLTQPLDEHTPCFPGDPAFRREPIPGQQPWRISQIAMSSHNGTHMDAPLHRIEGGSSIEQIPLSCLTGFALVLDATGFPENSEIPSGILDAVRSPLWPGWFALVRTGWDRHWRDARYFRHPYLSRNLAQRLVDSRCGLVAVDALSVDSTVDGGDAVHAILLGNKVLVAENLRGLHDLEPGKRYSVACLPLPMTGADGSPVRFIAWNPGEI
ncbi:MAG: cyclase family protein [Thermomicrobiales bacterium]